MKDCVITIAIPTYKRVEYLREAVYSIVNQPEFRDGIAEIVISLDRFADGTYSSTVYEYGLELAKLYSNIHFSLCSKPSGLAGNWNECAALANGEYTVIIGDDDRLCDNALSVFIEKIRTRQADVFFSNHYLINTDGSRASQEEIATEIFNRSDLKTGLLDNPEMKIWQNAIPISASAIRTSLIRKIRFDIALNTPEILFFVQCLTLNSASFYFINEYLIEYRCHESSATTSGLRVNLLFEKMREQQVTSVNYQYKKKFLQSLSSTAVTLNIRTNNIAAARQVFQSEYYRAGWKKTIAHILLLRSGLLRKAFLKIYG